MHRQTGDDLGGATATGRGVSVRSEVKHRGLGDLLKYKDGLALDFNPFPKTDVAHLQN